MRKVTEVMVGHESFGEDSRVIVVLNKVYNSDNSHEILELLPLLEKTWGLTTPLKLYIYEVVNVTSEHKTVKSKLQIILAGYWWKLKNYFKTKL